MDELTMLIKTCLARLCGLVYISAVSDILIRYKVQADA
jgi:hypothetical protein